VVAFQRLKSPRSRALRAMNLQRSVTPDLPRRVRPGRSA
jgi:hypothetical protein